MKKHEKMILAVFGLFILIFTVNALIRIIVLEIELDYHFFDGFTTALSIPFAVSFFGVIAILTNARLRKRCETDLPPISKLYTGSFWASFLPLLGLLIQSVYSAFDGFTFFETIYGSMAFTNAFVIYGVYVLTIMIPVFPVVFFWQILYLINRRRYRRKK